MTLKKLYADALLGESLREFRKGRKYINRHGDGLGEIRILDGGRDEFDLIRKHSIGRHLDLKRRAFRNPQDDALDFARIADHVLRCETLDVRNVVEEGRLAWPLGTSLKALPVQP